MNKKIVILIVVIIVIVAGLFIFNSYLKGKTGTESPVTSQPQTQDALDVPNQAGGQELFINSASSRSGGFVAVYRDNSGTPGKLIGVSSFISGGNTMTNFKFTLNETVQEGDILDVALHDDNGDSVFDPNTDQIAKDGNGAPLVKRITILSQGSLDNEVKL